MDQFVANPYVRLAAGMLQRAVQDLRTNNVYALSALRFLKSEWAAFLAEGCGIDRDHWRRRVNKLVSETLRSE